MGNDGSQCVRPFHSRNRTVELAYSWAHACRRAVRNAISAGKAINAAHMVLRGNGTHRVSLDQVIETMRVTWRDMSSKYKETSTGGLAVHVPVNVVEY